MIPLNKELNWLLTVILSGDKGSASAVYDLKTLISPIDWKINITLCKTITLPSWWIVLSVTGIGHLQFKQGTRTPRITKRSKERSKGPRKIQSLLQVEGMAMEQTEHSSRAQRYSGRDLVRELLTQWRQMRRRRGHKDCSEEKGWPPEMSWQTHRGTKYTPEIAVC